MTLRRWLYWNVYLKTPYWKAIRRKIGTRANWTCESKGCQMEAHNLDCHHVTYRVLWFEWLFPWLVIYLCRYHHNMTHNGLNLTLKSGRKLKGFGR